MSTNVSSGFSTVVFVARMNGPPGRMRGTACMLSQSAKQAARDQPETAGRDR